MPLSPRSWAGMQILPVVSCLAVWALRCAPSREPEDARDKRMEALERELAQLRSQLSPAQASAMPPAQQQAPAREEPRLALSDHASQARDETWAPAAEAFFLRELAPDAGKIGFTVVVDCRTTSCRVTVGVPDLQRGERARSAIASGRAGNCSPTVPVLPPPGQPYNAPFSFDVLLDCASRKAQTPKAR